ncbi:hypothetical protein G5V57_10165 [Nordella sp. HKS 07]|uniref:hypothetical protein n=1 Tax=Nordella sp. HKS 07 TaxID=2712222 RepID=UPI0013E1B4E6|nr:hypothetical protein [Nordella sp. HKS 07]QIG48056.1 hypothetical protein G5V57_10165 [Nordella sp. HKS 07]
MRILPFLVIFLGSLALAIPLAAQDCTAPCTGYEVTTELENDWIFAADPSFLKSDVLQPTITVDYLLAPTDYFQMAAEIITEPVVDLEPGESATFERIGTYADELYAVFEKGPALLQVGKFDTIFGLASEVLPGINADNIASNFDADERIGAELILGFDSLGINNTIAATAFTTDRTALSGSLFFHRPRTQLSDGGAGNTEGVSSFSIALNGCKGAEPELCYDDGDLGYRIGYRFQKAGRAIEEQIIDEVTPEDEQVDDQAPPQDDQATPQDEQAFLAAGFAKYEFDSDAALRLLGEAAYLRHFEGDQDDALILTGSAALERDNMLYIATYSLQKNITADGPDTRDYMVDLEAIYSSEEDTPIEDGNWDLGAAYTFERDAEDQEAHLFSVRLTLYYGGVWDIGK